VPARYPPRRDRRSIGGMTREHDIALEIALAAGGIDDLVDEILHYLDVVELFRREQYEPRWRSERPTAEVLA
jgi:hypothetical protein